MKINLRSMPRLESHEPAQLVRLSGARTAQFGAAALGVVLLAGSFLGGAAGHAGLARGSHEAWIEDGPRGQLVEIDTASGQAEQRLTVAAKGDVLEVRQRDDNLIVQDQTTGTLRTIDLTTLLSQGERSVGQGADTVVILDGPRVAIAELSAGVIQGIDPISSASVGRPYSVGAPLVSAVSDSSGHVWGLSSGGKLVELVWGGDGYQLRDSLQVKGAGAGSGLTAHDSGVTVMVTPTGSVEEVADDATTTTDPRPASGLGTQVLVGATTPADVVPAASRGTSIVVIATPTSVVQPDVAPAGCEHPLAPVVFQDKVYVPCDGSPEVVVLNPDGTSAGPPITVPTGHTPELSVANGTLVVNVPGASSVVLVGPTGSTSAVGTQPPGIPTTSQSDPAPMPTPSTPPVSSHPKDPTPSHSPSPSTRPSDAPTVGVTLSPGRPKDGAIAIAVDWSVTNADQVQKFLVTVAAAGGTSQTLQVSSAKRSAVISVSCPAQCSGTASVALIDTNGPGTSTSRPWTSVAPPQAGSTPSASGRPGQGGPGSGGPGAGGSGPGGTGTVTGSDAPVIGPSSSGLPTASGPAAPPVSGSSATPTPATSPKSPTPVASIPAPRQTTLAPEPAPTSAAPAPAPTSAAPKPTTAPPTTAPPTSAAPAPAPTTAAPPASPAAGEQVITKGQAALKGASVTLTITEPADWAASGWACAVENDGDDGSSGTFTCDSTTAFTEREATSGGDQEDYYIRATSPGGATVDSAHYTIDTPEPTCTSQACRCDSSYVSGSSGTAQAMAVEPAVEPAAAGRQDSDMPNQIAPCP